MKQYGESSRLCIPNLLNPLYDLLLPSQFLKGNKLEAAAEILGAGCDLCLNTVERQCWWVEQSNAEQCRGRPSSSYARTQFAFALQTAEHLTSK